MLVGFVPMLGTFFLCKNGDNNRQFWREKESLRRVSLNTLNIYNVNRAVCNKHTISKETQAALSYLVTEISWCYFEQIQFLI